MPASSILREVYQAHIDHFGEPDSSMVFDGGAHSDTFPDRIDVVVWRATADCDMSTFATIGMADRPMMGVDYRAELHFGIRARLPDASERDVARFLANLAMYPFQIGQALNWWHTIRDPGGVPLFVQAQSVILHPRFVQEGWDTIRTGRGEVRILNVIPITSAERELKSRAKIQEAIYAIDMFSPR